jgi:ankyrin repeat protein
VVSLLADVGANINAKDCDGMTPLHLAAFYGQAMVAVQLVEHGIHTQKIKVPYTETKYRKYTRALTSQNFYRRGSGSAKF